MSVDYQLPSPLQTTAGAQIYSFVGTSVTSSVGLAIAYAGCGLLNPSGSKVKVTLLKAGFAHVGGVAGASIPTGFAKLVTGTASLGTLSAQGAFGVITAPGQVGLATGSAQVFGTCTVLNGTAGPASNNALNYVTMLGGFSGTGVWNTPPNETHGEVTLMPGEGGMLVAQAAVTGFPYIVWAESPIQ